MQEVRAKDGNVIHHKFPLCRPTTAGALPLARVGFLIADCGRLISIDQRSDHLAFGGVVGGVILSVTRS
jgi:hypothetical protein